MAKGGRWGNQDPEKPARKPKGRSGRRFEDMMEYEWAKKAGPVTVRRVGEEPDQQPLQDPL
jgi:hypothetical protein